MVKKKTTQIIYKILSINFYLIYNINVIYENYFDK